MEQLKTVDNVFIDKFFEDAKALLPVVDNDPVVAFNAQLKHEEQAGHSLLIESVKKLAENSYSDLTKYSDKEHAFNYFLVEKLGIPITPGNIHSVAVHVLPAKDISHVGKTLNIASSPIADKLVTELYDNFDFEKDGEIHSVLMANNRRLYILPNCARDKFYRERQNYAKGEERKIASTWHSKKRPLTRARTRDDPSLGR